MNRNVLGLVFIGVVVIAVIYIYPYFVGTKIDSVTDLAYASVDEKLEANSYADLQDRNPELRTEIPSKNAGKLGCFGESLPITTTFSYDIRRASDITRPSQYLGLTPLAFDRGYSMVSLESINPSSAIEQGIFMDLYHAFAGSTFGDQVFCEYYMVDPQAGGNLQVAYYRSFTTWAYTTKSGTGHLSYKVKDKDCDGDVDDHDVQVFMCCRLTSEKDITSFDVDVSQQCISDIFSLRRGVFV